MKYDHKEQIYTFTSGRKVPFNRGIIGLNPENLMDGECFEGYDGPIRATTWTKEERRELAELMIDQWKIWGGID